MSNPGDDRGTSVEVPDWWMRQVRKIRASREDSLVALAAELSKAVDKERPWTHGTVSNFLTEDEKKSRTTIEMADAFSLLYKVPPFLFRIKAESLEEAIEIQGTVGKLLEKRGKSTPDAHPRASQIDQRAAALQEAVKDQKRAVQSRDERSGSGRSGRASRRS